MFRVADATQMYSYIKEHFVKTGFVPSFHEIAENFECSTHTVHKRMRLLEQRKLIFKKQENATYRLSDSAVHNLIVKRINKE